MLVNQGKSKWSLGFMSLYFVPVTDIDPQDWLPQYAYVRLDDNGFVFGIYPDGRCELYRGGQPRLALDDDAGFLVEVSHDVAMQRLLGSPNRDRPSSSVDPW
jgi:hypothetical protein